MNDIVIYTPRNYKLYIHINKYNNKKYVGITCQQVNERWRNGNGYKDNNHFFNSIKKYGWDGFDHIILYENLTQKEAFLLEKIYISALNTIAHGYNHTAGGEGKCYCYKFLDENIIGNIYGKLKVIKRDIERTENESESYWICECSCNQHTIVSVRQSKLFSGKTKSCGCLKKECNITNKFQENNIVALDNDSIIMYFNNLPEKYCILDIDLYKNIKNIGWNLYKSNCIQGYSNGENVSLYTYIFGCKLKSHARKNLFFKNNNNLDLRKDNIYFKNTTNMPWDEFVISIFSPQSDYIYYNPQMKKWELRMKKITNFKPKYYSCIYDAIKERNKYFNYKITKIKL